MRISTKCLWTESPLTMSAVHLNLRTLPSAVSIIWRFSEAQTTFYMEPTRWADLLTTETKEIQTRPDCESLQVSYIGIPQIDMSSGNGDVSSHLQAESLGMGFILLDACFRLICASEEAVAILAHPRVPSKNKGFENFLQRRIQSLLPSNGGHNGFSPSKFPNEFVSGKRCYQVRVFPVKSNLKNGQRPAVALLLERNHRGILQLQTVARRLRMTPRETETVDF